MTDSISPEHGASPETRKPTATAPEVVTSILGPETKTPPTGVQTRAADKVAAIVDKNFGINLVTQVADKDQK